MRRFTSRGQRRVNAHQITSRRKLLPSPLSPVTRFTRSAKSSAISGAGPTLSSFKCSIIAFPRHQALSVRPLAPQWDSTAHAKSRHCLQTRSIADATLSAIISRRDISDSIYSLGLRTYTSRSNCPGSRHLHHQDILHPVEGACMNASDLDAPDDDVELKPPPVAAPESLDGWDDLSDEPKPEVCQRSGSNLRECHEARRQQCSRILGFGACERPPAPNLVGGSGPGSVVRTRRMECDSFPAGRSQQPSRRAAPWKPEPRSPTRRASR